MLSRRHASLLLWQQKQTPRGGTLLSGYWLSFSSSFTLYDVPDLKWCIIADYWILWGISNNSFKIGLLFIGFTTIWEIGSLTQFPRHCTTLIVKPSLKFILNASSWKMRWISFSYFIFHDHSQSFTIVLWVPHHVETAGMIIIIVFEWVLWDWQLIISQSMRLQYKNNYRDNNREMTELHF